MNRAFPARRVRALLAAAVMAVGPTVAPAGLDRPAEGPEGAHATPPLYLLQDTRPAAAATAPSTVPVDGQALSIRVKELKGIVSASADDGKTWKRVAVGDTFGQGTLFRTGLRSGVTCEVGPSQMFTLESLTTIRVEEAIRTGGKEKTDLQMKYGAASYGIEAAGREYDAVIRTPGSTMAVRGTVVRVSDRAGFSPVAESYTGRALFRTARGSTFLGGGGYSVASAAQGTAAETGLANSTVDPSIAAARTKAESTVVAQQLSQGGIIGFDQRAGIPVVRNSGELPDSSLPGAIPGRLGFALRWSGNADLNFIVDNQEGDQMKLLLNGFKPTEILFPGYGLNTTPSGGLIPFDNRGGSTGGTEIAYWKNSFPIGEYGVGVLHASGGEANFRINAFLDGKALPIIIFDAEGNLAKVNTFRGTVGPGGSDGAILFVPRFQFAEDLVPDGEDPVAQQVAARAIAAMRNASPKPQNKPTVAAATTPKPAAAVKPTVAPAKPTKTNVPTLSNPKDYVKKYGPAARPK